MSQNVIARQRLCLTADKSELVDASDERAAFLFANTGDEIVAAEAERFGLVDGALPGFEAEAADAAEAGQDAKAQAETKPAPAAETKPAKPGKAKA